MCIDYVSHIRQTTVGDLNCIFVENPMKLIVFLIRMSFDEHYEI